VKITATSLDGVDILEPDVFGDDRGYFMETYQANRYGQFSVDRVFVQDNLSFSKKGTLRGLHYQLPHPQAKLIQAVSGEIYDVAVDIRRDSSTFGRWVGVHLSDKNHRQFFVPEGFAHGFCVLSETAHVMYKCTELYHPDDEKGVLWSDPAIGIDWPVKNPCLFPKDMQFPCLKDIPFEQLFQQST